MQSFHDKNKEQAPANTTPKQATPSKATASFVDNRPQAIQMRKLQEVMHNNSLPHQKTPFVDNRPQAIQMRKLQEKADQYSQQQALPIQKHANKTGLPDNLKSGVENLSGHSMDDVKVHYNSDKPAQLNAHAYAQGTDIHLASGQEKHLPHEAWHVVQQKQGRVKPTIQMKGEININDDKGLEKEADVMGAKAVQTRHDNRTLQKANITPIFQRKINFIGLDKEKKEEIEEKLESSEIKEKLENSEEIWKKDREDNIIYTKLNEILTYLITSPYDYGRVNFDNPQHILNFIYYALHYLNREKIDVDIEKIDADIEKIDAEIWNIDKELLQLYTEGVNSEQIFKTILLGTGASVAYYIEANRSSLDQKNTAIIGKKQPWDPKNNESRGIEFINHPMHMISPNRDKANIPKKEDGTDEQFNNNAKTLTDEIKTASDGFRQIDASIRQISKRTLPYEIKIDDKTEIIKDTWYIIETNASKTFYAQNIKAGLGIGPHRIPNNKKADLIKTDKDKQTEKTRVMDLDRFQRELKNEDSTINKEKKQKEHLVIGVSGPNAGTDAVYTATNAGMYVDWIVSGGGPAIAAGMGNKINKKGMVELYFDYLNGWSINGDKVVLNISGKWGNGNEERRKLAEDEFSKKHPGWFLSKDSVITVDYLVYAQGPDISKIWDLFDESLQDDLNLKTDSSEHFKDKDKVKTVIGYGSEDDTLEIIGGSIIRMLQKTKKLNNLNTMNTITKSLSSTILNTDQLTSIRSMIEAKANYMPSYIGTEESNFITDDQTMIAVQIASVYQYIPPSKIEKITTAIIEDRKENIIPGTKNGSRAFTNKWTNILINANQDEDEDETKLDKILKEALKTNIQETSYSSNVGDLEFHAIKIANKAIKKANESIEKAIKKADESIEKATDESIEKATDESIEKAIKKADEIIGKAIEETDEIIGKEKKIT